MEQPREYKHLGNPLGQQSGGRYARNWVFFRQRPKAYKFRILFNTDKKGNTKFTREDMADTKSRTPPSSARQIYGRVMDFVSSIPSLVYFVFLFLLVFNKGLNL